MSKHPQRQLDQLLQAWGDEHALRAKDSAELQRRIENQLANGESAALVRTAPPSSPGRNRTQIVALAVAAALVICVGLTSYFAAPKQHASTRPADLAMRPDDRRPPDASWLAYLKQQGLLLANYQDVFDHRIAWLVESEGRGDFGLLPADASAAATEQQYVAIELKLVSRSAGTRSWKHVQTYHVLARREEWIELPAADGESSQLAIWVYPVDDDKISIDLRYQPLAHSGVRIETSNLQRAGEAISIRSFEQDGIEYHLLQTADLLDRTDLG